MTDTEIEDGLRSLGIGRENLKVVALLPLVQVAWADGKIQQAERTVIRDAAARLGLGNTDVLESWLGERPTSLQFLVGQQILLALSVRGNAELMPDTLPLLIEWCSEVAESAGGLFDMAFKVERSEREVIAEIANLLQLGPAVDWDAVARAFPEAESLHE